MQTIAEQLREEGIKIGEKNMQTIAQQLKKEGKREEKIETAKRMLLNNFSVEQVITITGLTAQEVKALIN
jgi:predicted transposase/invertase (TIGR01784 family)